MDEAKAFLDRVFDHLPKSQTARYEFVHWSRTDKPTDEGVGLLPVPGIDPAKVMARVRDLNNYTGNVEYVLECHIIADARFVPPSTVRFYQKITVPLLKNVHHELVLIDGGERQGYQVAYWYMLEQETLALSPKVAARSQYNVGAWIAAPGVVGYALSSAPRREDVNFLQWKALTTGADVAASKVIKGNIECMSRWARRT